MAVILVERSDDNATQSFDASEIGSGPLVGFVTANDSSADGFVTFLNQVGTDGNSLPPSSDRRGKIVENGSLITNGAGDPTVKWDGENDGYFFDIPNTETVSQSRIQTVDVTIDPDQLSGRPQEILNSDGLRIWERSGVVYATISNPDAGWKRPLSKQQNDLSYFKGYMPYDGNMYAINGNSKVMEFDGTDWSESFSMSGFHTDMMVVYNDKLWATDDASNVYSFDGSTWTTAKTFSSGTIENWAVVDGDLIALVDDPPNSLSDKSLYKYDGNTWTENWLESGDFAGLPDDDWQGMVVWRDNLYLATNTASSPTPIWEYDSDSQSWSKHSEVPHSEVLFIGVYDDTLVASPFARKVWIYNEGDNSWSKILDVSEDSYHIFGYTAFDKNVYTGQKEGWYTGEDEIRKYDGQNFTTDFNLADFSNDFESFNGPWRPLNVYKGELWTYKRWVAGQIFRKGNGEEISQSYDTNANTLNIRASVTESTLILEVNGTTVSTTHSIDYKHIDQFRAGLSYGSSTADSLYGLDEAYHGSFRKIMRWPKLNDDFKTKAFSVFSPPILNITNTTSSSVEGNVIFDDYKAVPEFEILHSSSSGGPFSVIATISAKQGATWSHTGLSSETEQFYKVRAVDNNLGLSVESPAETRVRTTTREFFVVSPPENNLSDFSVYGDLSELGSDFWNNVSADGSGIRIKDYQGNTIPREVVEIDTGSETGEVMFKPSTLRSGVKNFFIVEATGNSAPAPSDPNGRNAVWSNGFERVYNMADDPSGGTVTDSSGGSDGTLVGGMTSSDRKSSSITSYYYELDGNDDKIEIPMSYDWTTGDFTFELVIRHRGWDTWQGDDIRYPLTPLGTESNGNDTGLVYYSGWNYVYAGWDGNNFWGYRAKPQSDSKNISSNQPNRYDHIFMIQDGNTFKFYLNGELVEDNTNYFDWTSAHTIDLELGGPEINSGQFGPYDIAHLAIQNTARSSDWVKMRHKNFFKTSEFLT